MTLHSFVDRLTQLFSWLYYQHLWEEWELLAIGVVVLVPLLVIARRQRKERTCRIYTHHDPERSPIIGVKLANGKHSPSEITDSKKAHSHSVARGKSKQDDVIKQLAGSNEQIKELQCEIARHRQAEARLERQLAELTAANEKLKHEINEFKQAEEHLQQQTVELLAMNKELQEGCGGRKRAEGSIQEQTDLAPVIDKHPRSDDAENTPTEEHAVRQPLSLIDADKPSSQDLHRPDQDASMLAEKTKHPTDSKRTNEPLDVEKLKAIAALAKQIQQRPRPELR